MSEVQAADARGGPHGKRFGDEHSSVLFHVEQAPQRSFFGMVGASGVAGTWPDSAILLLDQVGAA